MTNPEPICTWGVVICVATNGHVWVAKSATMDEHFVHLQTARVIRRWGTTQGLNQLVGGPTTETQLDAIAPIVSVAQIALIMMIPCTESGWEQDLV